MSKSYVPTTIESREKANFSRVKITHNQPTCWLLGAELDGLGLGPEVLAGAVNPDVHALGDVVRLLQGQVPERERDQ